MNEDELKLDRQLSEATRGDAGRCHAPDAETAALADAWQALGHLLERANADFRPELVIKQLRWRLLRQRLWRRGGLLAATLLIGLGIAWCVNRGSADKPAGALPGGANMIVTHRPEKPAGGDVASPKSEKPAVVQSPATSKSPTPTLAASATNSGWDQSLDDQITEADDSVRTAETLGSRGDDQIEQLDRELVSFRQDVEASSL
jgi:hypothetical protein